QHLPARSVAGLRALADRRAADRANQRPGDGRGGVAADEMERPGRVREPWAGPGGKAAPQVPTPAPAPPFAEPKLGNDRAHGVPILFSMLSLFNSRILMGE